MTEFFPLLWWTLAGAVIVGGAIYLLMEYQAYLLRTTVVSVPGGLRFVAQSFSVEVRHGTKEIKVITKNGRYLRQPLPAGDEQIESGALTVTLAAVGLQIEVSRVCMKAADNSPATATGVSRIVLLASDDKLCQAQGKPATERSELRLDGVPDSIALDFQQFANSVRAWIEKVEQQLEAQLVAKRQREAEEATAAAGLAVDPTQDDSVPLSEVDRETRAAAQIEKWRAAAGFKGTSTEVSFDARGQIVWLIDLDQTGRVILHANGRTFHGRLKGATVTGVGTEIEISVRDDYWSEDDPRLVPFRVLGGTSAESRRAWKERLEIVIQSVSPTVHQPR